MNTDFLHLFEKVKKAEFEFNTLHRDLWHQIINNEKDAVRIHFDLENDDPTSHENPRTIDTGLKSPGDSTYKVLAQPHTAGGDWECPVAYFRCQLVTGTSKGKLFVFIPSKEDGNICLEPGDTPGVFAAASNSSSEVGWKDIKWKPLWDALKEDCIERIKLLDDPKLSNQARMYNDYQVFNS